MKKIKSLFYCYGWKTFAGFVLIFIATIDAQVADIINDADRILCMSIGVLLAGVGARSAVGKLIESFKEIKKTLEEKL